MPEESSVLESAVASLSKATGVEVCVYDYAYFSYSHPDLKLTTRSRWHCSAYCMKLKEAREAHAACVRCELGLSKRAMLSSEPVTLMCHAGLTQLLLPIRRARRCIGMVSLGQSFIDTAASRSKVASAARRFGHNGNELLRTAARQSLAGGNELRRHAPLCLLLRRFVEVTVDTVDLREELTRASGAPGAGAGGRIDMKRVPNYFLERFYNVPDTTRALLAAIGSAYWENGRQSDYAAKVGMSPRKFSAVLMRDTGYSFRDLIKKARASAAAFLLKSEGRAVSETAYAVGYEDTSAFSHAFTDVFGVSPSAYAANQASVPDEHFVIE
jgi:AraC-like DNA-binding protein/ligand-binding sensor protein